MTKNRRPSNEAIEQNEPDAPPEPRQKTADEIIAEAAAAAEEMLASRPPAAVMVAAPGKSCGSCACYFVPPNNDGAQGLCRHNPPIILVAGFKHRQVKNPLTGEITAIAEPEFNTLFPVVYAQSRCWQWTEKDPLDVADFATTGPRQ